MLASTRPSVLHPALSDHCLLPISRHIRVSSSRSAAARWRDLGIARFAISPVRLSRSPSAHLVRDDTDTRTRIVGYPRPILRRLSHCTLWRGAVTASNSGGPARERAPHVAARSAVQPHGQLGDGSGHHGSECEVPEALRWRTRWQTPLLLFDDADHLAVLSVDSAKRFAALRNQLALLFPILGDVSRAVVQAWGLYNPREMGGIAVPAVFVIDRDLRVRWRSVDSTRERVSADGVLRFLRGEAAAGSLARSTMRAGLGA